MLSLYQKVPSPNIVTDQAVVHNFLPENLRLHHVLIVCLFCNKYLRPSLQCFHYAWWTILLAYACVSFKVNINKKAPPAGNRKWCTARGITCPSAIHSWLGGGYSNPVLIGGYPHPGPGLPHPILMGGGPTPSSPDRGNLSSLVWCTPFGRMGYPLSGRMGYPAIGKNGDPPPSATVKRQTRVKLLPSLVLCTRAVTKLILMETRCR